MNKTRNQTVRNYGFGNEWHDYKLDSLKKQEPKDDQFFTYVLISVSLFLLALNFFVFYIFIRKEIKLIDLLCLSLLFLFDTILFVFFKFMAFI